MPDREQSREQRDLVGKCLRTRRAALLAEQVSAARHRAQVASVAQALSAGVPAAELATAMGLSRQRVYQMRDEAAQAGPDGVSSPAVIVAPD